LLHGDAGLSTSNPQSRSSTDASACARRAALVAAEQKANALFDAIEGAGLVAAGRTEREISIDIFELAKQRFGIEKFWHKRIVRAGVNTLTTAWDHPDDRTVEADDTVYIDLGPVFEEWEADIGRTYVVGASPEKRRLVDDLERVFVRVQQHAQANPDITGADLYAFAQQAAQGAGWEFGGRVAGHIVSEFAHAWLTDDKPSTLIGPENPTRLSDPDSQGRERHWILEIHLVDRARTFGGFYERLL
jgi:Xaa-Pro aminopeptidase